MIHNIQFVINSRGEIICQHFLIKNKSIKNAQNDFLS